MYSYDKVYNATLNYFNGDELATNVWMSKYAMQDGKGNYLELTPTDMHRRMAKEFARIENKYPNAKLTEEDIYNLFGDFKYIVPQGRVMAGLGVKNSYRSLSNCLVLPSPLDSYSSIMYTDTMLVSAAKRGCGYGLDLSNLRPKGSQTKNAANTSTGIVSFMERYSNSTREVGQAGRRGACLLGLDISHPESPNFLKSKVDTSKITGANISLKIPNVFMEKVIENSTFDLTFDSKIYETVNARELWLNIVKHARNTAEPGIFFWDRMQNYDPVSVYENHQIVLTNACGEQPMSELDTCRLITLNLWSVVKNPFTKNAQLDEKLLYEIAYKQLRLADNLVDLEVEYLDRIIKKIENDPEPIEQKIIELTMWQKVKDKALRGRRVGCGITGLGDMLAGLNVKYGSNKSLIIIDKLMRIKLQAELDASTDLAKERGTFPDYNPNLEFKNSVPQNAFYKMLQVEFPTQTENMQNFGRRNINWSTIAPVGSVSILTQTTSGCEPLFQTGYIRRRKIEKNEDVKANYVDQNGDSWQEYKVLHDKYKQWLDTDPLYTFENPYITANDIDWLKRVEIQAILQKYTTSAISSTINLPNDVSIETVDQIYRTAWQKGLKGITIYRDGSRSGVLVTDTTNENKINKNNAPKRPKILSCKINNTKVKGEQWVVLVGYLNDDPYEVFAFTNGRINYKAGELIKQGGGKYDLICDKQVIIKDIGGTHMTDEEQALTRMISLALRHGADLKYVFEQLDKSHGTIVSFSKAIMRTLKKFVGTVTTKAKCDECGGELIYESSCFICKDCGWSKCG